MGGEVRYLARFLSMVRNPMQRQERMFMKVDVIIPVYRPGEEFREMLKRLESQTVPVHKIIIMNTKAGEFPRAYVEGRSNIEVFHLEPSEFDHGGTRNAGAGKSEADYLLFLTQDALPADVHLIENLLKAFENPKVKAAYARQLPKADCKELERYTRSFNYPEQGRVKTGDDLQKLGIKTFFCSNVCAMYERKTYLEQGGFVSPTIFNEDMIYAGGLIQKGYAIAYVAEALVYHSHNYNGSEQLRRNFDLAVSQVNHPEIFQGIASESEGIRLVKQTAAYCFRIRKPWLIFGLVFSSGCKYIGYKLGKSYQKLPRRVILACTMNRAYWEK